MVFSAYLCFSIAPSSHNHAMNLRRTLNSWPPCCLHLCCTGIPGVRYHRAYAVLRIESWALYMLDKRGTAKQVRHPHAPPCAISACSLNSMSTPSPGLKIWGKVHMARNWSQHMPDDPGAWHHGSTWAWGQGITWALEHIIWEADHSPPVEFPSSSHITVVSLLHHLTRQWARPVK